MRRKAAIVCAGIEPRRFDTLGRRGQFPFVWRGEGWANLTLDDVFRLRLMMDLMDDGGLDLINAAEVAQFGVSQKWISRHPLDKSTEPQPDIWVGQVLYVSSFRYPDEKRLKNHFACLDGEVETIAKGAARCNFPDSQIVRFAAVNASRAARFVFQNAVELGLPEAEGNVHWHRPIPGSEIEEMRRDALEADKDV